jgi:hypothetical protein
MTKEMQEVLASIDDAIAYAKGELPKDAVTVHPASEFVPQVDTQTVQNKTGLAQDSFTALAWR